MSTYNICFHWEIRKISAVFGWKKVPYLLLWESFMGVSVYKNLSQGSLPGFAERCQTVIPRNGLYMHQTPVTDSFPYIPFNFLCFFLSFSLILNATLLLIHNEADIHHLESWHHLSHYNNISLAKELPPTHWLTTRDICIFYLTPG